MYRRVIFEFKQKKPDGDVIEIRVWKVDISKQHPEGIRYSMVYISNGKRLVGYDNYHGKGHHRHICGREEPYAFVDEWKTIEDFTANMEKIRSGVIK